MPGRRSHSDNPGQIFSEDDGVVVREGERYLDVEHAAAYLGKKRATVFTYLKKFGGTLGIRTYKFPLHGKRVFLKQTDLDRMRNAGPFPTGPAE